MFSGAKSKADMETKVDSKLYLKRKGVGSVRACKKPAKKEKVEKDLNKPKSPASAFFIFMEHFHKQFKEKKPNIKSVSIVGKAGGDKWKSMSEAEKAPYVAEAAKRKTEYNKNMAAYSKNQYEGGKDQEEELSDEDDESGDEEEEDPNKPKRPASAFFVFLEEFRKQFKKENPSIKLVSVVGKAGGDKWKSMSEAQKAPYITEAAKRKTQYDKNMAAYKKKQSKGVKAQEGEEPDNSKSEAYDKDDESGKKENDDLNKPKRPPSSFYVFMEEFPKQSKQKNPNPNSKSISVEGKAGGDKWKSMSEAEKASYVAEAAKRKTEYSKNMAAYNKKQSDGGKDREEEKSDKSKSEVDDKHDESGKKDNDGLNKPKRLPYAFFVFMEVFHMQFKEENPNNKSISVECKAGGDKWKSMSEAEKAPYVAEAAKRMTEYSKNMAAYNKKYSDGGKDHEEEKSDKSKSEVNDKDDESGKKDNDNLNKPKLPLSAFFIFMEEFRKQFKEKNPNNKSISIEGKAGGDKWKSMSEAEKAPYIAEAAKRKTEYNKHMAAYNKKQSVGGTDQEEEESNKSKAEVNDKADEDDGSGEEDNDDLNKPKSPAAAFFIFMEQFRKQFQEKNPNNKSVSIVGKAGGDKWKSMSEAEKAPYVAEVAKRKTEYNKNMAVYNKKQSEGGKDQEEELSDKSKLLVNDEDDESGDEDEDDPNKPKRPADPFFVFLEEFRKQFKKENPSIKSVSVVGKAGDKWKSMSEAEKAPYVTAATEEKTQYNQILAAYNKKQSEGGKDQEEEESDKSKSVFLLAAFFVFMEEFQKQFKEKNPSNRSVSVVGKAGGDKWMSMSEAEKAPYLAEAGKVECNKKYGSLL